MSDSCFSLPKSAAAAMLKEEFDADLKRLNTHNLAPGGNSKSFDWNLLSGKNIDLPWFISGGINEKNIKNIQKIINPNGIDLSSGVEESIGIKSNIKINNLFKKYYGN